MIDSLSLCICAAVTCLYLIIVLSLVNANGNYEVFSACGKIENDLLINH